MGSPWVVTNSRMAFVPSGRVSRTSGVIVATRLVANITELNVVVTWLLSHARAGKLLANACVPERGAITFYVAFFFFETGQCWKWEWRLYFYLSLLKTFSLNCDIFLGHFLDVAVMNVCGVIVFAFSFLVLPGPSCSNSDNMGLCTIYSKHNYSRFRWLSANGVKLITRQSRAMLRIYSLWD